MYEPREGDVSGRNYQDEMRTMLTTMIPVYEGEGVDFILGLGPSLIKEFNDMLEFAGATVTGVEDRARAIIDYLEHHYHNGPKPKWYASLTE